MMRNVLIMFLGYCVSMALVNLSGPKMIKSSREEMFHKRMFFFAKISNTSVSRLTTSYNIN